MPPNATDLEIEESIDTESRKIEIRFFVHSAESISFKVEQDDFGNDLFLFELKKIIGKTIPARKNSETWNEDIMDLAREIVTSPHISEYLREEISKK